MQALYCIGARRAGGAAQSCKGYAPLAHPLIWAAPTHLTLLLLRVPTMALGQTRLAIQPPLCSTSYRSDPRSYSRSCRAQTIRCEGAPAAAGRAYDAHPASAPSRLTPSPPLPSHPDCSTTRTRWTSAAAPAAAASGQVRAHRPRRGAAAAAGGCRALLLLPLAKPAATGEPPEKRACCLLAHT